jgi:hypothetical protein
MKITVKNKSLYDMLEGIVGGKTTQGVFDIPDNPFAYRVKRTKDGIVSAIKLAEKTRNVPEEALEMCDLFDKERAELAKSLSKKDEKGNPVIDKNGYVIEDQELWIKLFEELKVKHHTAFEVIENTNKRFFNELEKEIELEIFHITEEQIPNKITGRQIDGIDFMIEKIQDSTQVSTDFKKKMNLV